MLTRSARIGKVFMDAQAYYALVLSLLWITRTEVMFVSIFAGYTGRTLAEALAANSKEAALWLIAQRLIGVELLPTSVLMVFIVRQSYKMGERWSWYALLVAGIVTWGGLISYKLATGYFDPNPSSLTFLIGAALFLLGITLPAREFLGQQHWPLMSSGKETEMWFWQETIN